MQQVVTAISVLMAIVPLVGYLAVIWWMDRYEREPLWLTGLTFVWGAVGGTLGALVFASMFQLGVDAVVGHGGSAAQLSNAIGAVVIAPVVEEATKGAVLLVLLMTRWFDNATDGVIYGAATGLGFAMTENFLYFTSVYREAGVEAWMVNVVVRTLFSAVVHCCASSAFGFFLGLSRYRTSFLAKLLLLPIGYLAAISIHAFWNGSMTIGGLYEGGGAFALGAYLVLPCIALVMIALTQGSLHLEHRLLRRELEEEEVLGYIPRGHAAILPYYTRRRRAGWLAPGIDREDYVKVATKLAFRKSQVRVRKGPAAQALLGEVEELRRRVVKLILGEVPQVDARRTQTAYVEIPIVPPPGGGA